MIETAAVTVLLFITAAPFGAAQVTVIPAPGSADDLRSRIATTIGPSATNCGEHDSGDVIKRNPVTAQMLQGFLDCLADARSRGVSAWAFQSGSGFDSWTADGLMVGAGGATTHFHYDSIRCRRDNCDEAMEAKDCPLPRVNPSPSWPHFECLAPR